MLSTPKGFEVPRYPSWMCTVHNGARVTGHIDVFSELAYNLGYVFIVWNDRVYHIWKDHDIVMANDTGWTKDDVDYFTANHPDIERVSNPTKESW